MIRILSISAIFLIVFINIGCSGSKQSPVTPQNESSIPEFSLQADLSDYTNQLWGSWGATFNPDQLSLQLEPVREQSATFDITSQIPIPGIVVNSYNPASHILDVDVTISNPYPITGFDVRLIIYTDNSGNQLLNDDGWTNQFDRPGGFIGNPFKAYAKDQPNRMFSGSTQHTENLQIYWPSGAMIYWAVIGSAPSNTTEPYKFENFNHTELNPGTGSSCTVSVDVLDWQSNAGPLYMYENTISSGGFQPMAHGTGNTWSMTLTNNNSAPVGEYEAIVAAYSSDSGSVVLFDYFTITITEAVEEHGWASNWGGWSADYGRGVAVDSQGNVYCYGAYKSDDFDIDPDPLIEDIRPLAGSTDLFLSKFDKNGNYLMGYNWGGTYVDDVDEYGGACIAVDNDDNVYVCGRFYYTVDMDPTKDTANFTADGSESDAFITKFSPSGAYLWTKTWGSEETDWAVTVACDGSDYVYVGGIMWGSTDLDPGPGEDWHYLNGPLSIFNWDGYMIKLDPDGNWVLAKHWGGTSSDWVEGLDVDKDHNVIVTGAFYETVNFNPDGPAKTRISNGVCDAYVLKLNSAGVFQWVNAWGAESYDYGTHSSTDSQGNVYTAGYFSETCDMNPDPYAEDFLTSNGSFRFDASISAFTPSGGYKWAYGWGGTERDAPYCIDVDGFDNIYITGKYQYTADFDPTSGADIRTSAGGEDIFLSVFRPSGDRWYTLTWGGESIDEGTGVFTTKNGNCYLTGKFASDTILIDFNPGPDEYFLIPVGSVDPYLVKLLPGGVW